MSESHIVIFDGVCNLCNGAVKFIIRRDPNRIFSFTPMQSESGKRLIGKYDATGIGVETILLIKNGQCYERSDAAIEIAGDLTGFWSMFRFFRVLPRSFRDYFYRLVARNRYKLFGRSEECTIPPAEVRDRFFE